MGRRVPDDNISLIGPFLYFSFSFVGLVTSIAIIIALCSVRFRRKSPPQPRTLSNPFDVTKTMKASTPPTSTTMEQAITTTISLSSPEHPRTSEVITKLENKTEYSENNEELMKELPLPPAMQQPNNNNDSSSIAKRATSERRMSFNLSMKMLRSLSMAARNRDPKEDNNDIGKKEKLKADESVWMKTIILGGKCVPDEEEDAVIYEGKGKKISAYHPRNSTSSMSLSRQWSSVALDVTHSHEERINNI